MIESLNLIRGSKQGVFGEIEVLGHLLENEVNKFDIFASDKIKLTKILTWTEILNLTNTDSKLHQFAKQKLHCNLTN